MKNIKFCYFVSIHVVAIILALSLIKMEWFSEQNHSINNKGKFYKRMVVFHRRIDNDLPDGSVIFVGDSLIQGLAVNVVTPNSVNFGIGGDTTSGVIKRLPFYKSLKNAKLVVISIGINDLRKISDESIVENLSQIKDMLPLNVPVVFNTLFPVAEGPDIKASYNRRINKINNFLLKLCEQEARLYCLDLSKRFKDKSGQLSSDYHVGDGLHLNSAATALWIAELRQLYLSVTYKADAGLSDEISGISKRQEIH